jgi:hypothetical protein
MPSRRYIRKQIKKESSCNFIAMKHAPMLPNGKKSFLRKDCPIHFDSFLRCHVLR